MMATKNSISKNRWIGSQHDQGKTTDQTAQLGGQEQSQSFCAPSFRHGLSTPTQASQPGDSRMEDNRVDVPIELTDKDWYTLMKIAHERDVTLNQLVEQILTLEIERLEREQS
jgi:hypothetical protein